MPAVAPSAPPPSARTTLDASPPAAPPAETALDTVPIDLTEDGLPRRVRRSAAAEPPATDEPSHESGGAPSMRPPEQTRAMMSAFQSAVNRGRRDAGSVAGAGSETVAEPEQET
jgi:hypothetical protein